MRTCNTGLLSLAMHKMGYGVLSTDIATITSTLLQSNLAHNRSSANNAPVLKARPLDWFALPSTWNFSRPSITPLAAEETGDMDALPMPHGVLPLGPPFDLILTSDTAYDRELTTPLLRTLAGLCELSSSRTPPPIFLALEVRDPALIGAFLAEARNRWAFKTTRVANERLERLMGPDGIGWDAEDWEGVQVWKLTLSRKGRKQKEVVAHDGSGEA